MLIILACAYCIVKSISKLNCCSIAYTTIHSNNGKEPGLGAANSLVQANHDGEELTTQAGVNIVNINGQNVSSTAASERFDEPLTKAQVLLLVDGFIV